MKTFKQRLMLVATLMVIAVSGYAEEEFKTIFTTNFDDGNLGKWNSWGNSSTGNFDSPGYGDQGKCLKLYNPSVTAFDQAQLGYDLDDFLVSAKTYKISFYAKFEGEDENCQLQFQYQNKPSWGSQKRFDPVTITKQWAPYEIVFSTDYTDVNQILINFGQNRGTFYIDDIVFGYYEEPQGPDPGTGTTPGTTPTGSLNKMYYDGEQWCLMLEDFEGETIGDTLRYKHEQPNDPNPGKAEVVADPHGKSKKSLNFITGHYKSGDYYYIDVTLPNSKTLSSTYFEKLIFDIVYNNTGDNTHKHFKVKIDNTSNQLGEFVTDGNPNWASWETKTFDLTGKYTDSNTFRIYIGGESAQHANMFIDNIRLSVKTTANGTCGSPTLKDAGWMLDGNTLYISGTGDIADYESSSNIPWKGNKANISNIIIGEGITAIGKNNFYDHNAITSISLPSTLTKIGEQAFYASSSETNLAIDLIIPEGVTSIGSKAFYSRNGLKSVVLPSTLQEIGSQGLYVNNGNTPIPFTFHSNPTLGDKALYKNNTSYTATLVLDDARSPFFAATSANTFNGGIHYKRTLSAQYSTISLPFKPTSGLENCTFYQLSGETINALVFDKVQNKNLVAHKPYIVKTEGQTPAEIDFSTDESIEIPANAVADKTVLGTWEPKWTMYGTYSTLVINSGENANAYGFTGDALKRNAGNMTVKPFRAYLTKSSDVNAKDYLDVIFGGEVTGIERNEFSPEGITEIFSLDGKKHDSLQKGMNIVKMNNGSIKKIVIK